MARRGRPMDGHATRRQALSNAGAGIGHPSVIAPFELQRLPRILFGPGIRTRLPGLAAGYGVRILLVTGARSLRASLHGRALYESFRAHGLDVHGLVVSEEPSPRLV